MNKKRILYVFNLFNYNLIFCTEDVSQGLCVLKDLYMSGCGNIDFVILPSDLSFREWRSSIIL